MRRWPLMTSAWLAAVCAGCGNDQAGPAPDEGASGAEPSTSEAPAAASPAGIPEDADGEVYTVDPDASEVFWTVSSAGPMARFGHSHVISAETFSGTVVVDADDPARSLFELEIPVADLVVDDPELRSRLGEEFESEPSEEDIAGTRANMLGEDLLMADAYPVITLRGAGPRDTDAGRRLPVEIRIVGESFDFDLPGEVVFGDGSLEASGEFALDHADLGLMPFSALGGALQVAPTIEFSYSIRAVAAR